MSKNTGVSESRILDVLHTTFHRTQFRSNQLEIVKAVLSQRDVMVVLPTGHGKSLTFQLPAVIESEHGFYLVISPLLALIRDQVQQLQQLNILAETINSTTPSDERQHILTNFRSGRGCLLYVSPEQCVSPNFCQFLRQCAAKNLVNRVVVDEAHCAVEWGADFRKDYAKLGAEFRQRLPDSVPFMALTGTASPPMRERMQLVLGLRNPCRFVASLRRPHLHYEVRYVEDAGERLTDLLRFLKMYHHRIKTLKSLASYPGCGLVYCRSRNSTETIAKEINKELGQCAHAYHAGLPTAERAEIMRRWIAGDFEHSIVIATIAFGLGIDKPNTRFVIHFDLPTNIEAYVQQTGRGGRDRKAARCILYFSAAEAQKCLRFAKPGEEQQSAQSLVRFATTINRCRHDVLSEYFGDAVVNGCNYACDFCKMPRRLHQRYYQWHAEIDG